MHIRLDMQDWEQHFRIAFPAISKASRLFWLTIVVSYVVHHEIAIRISKRDLLEAILGI